MSALLASIAEDDAALAKFLESGEQEMIILDKENHPNIPSSVCDFDVNVNQLNAELAALGVNASLVSPGDGIYAEKAFIVAVDTVTILLKHHRNAFARAEQTEEKLSRAKQDLASAMKQTALLEDKNRRLEKALASSEATTRSAQNAADDARVKLQREIQELKSQLQPLQQRDKYYTNETKKKEREMERLQSQLNTVLFDKRRAARPAMHGARGAGFQLEQARSVESAEANRFCQMVSKSYEQRYAELLAENDELRDAVHQAQRCLRGELEGSELSTPQRESDEVIQNSSSSRNTPSTPCMELLPVKLVRSAVRASLQSKIEQLALRTAAAQQKLAASSSISAAEDAGDDDVEALKVQLSYYKNLVEAQTELIQETLPGMDSSGRQERTSLSRPQRAASPPSAARRSSVPLCTPDVRATLTAHLNSTSPILSNAARGDI
eukprot:CAMPEP_0185847308 /NCGR_PEP_ID=MMETSP1354-20130828/2626_1 /TAXON_ID=708628 /ORGANISM="Erythrolobus madagascarensis, Strain CCMP3276" /LENGTH=438 /DNA_ID=CAMNT_0028547579 /DNA_START=23 /DNA_END=1339 /DNA_ORIENTATION=-